MRVGIIALEQEILVPECEQIGSRGIDPHCGERARRTGQLKLRLLQVIELEMRVTKRVHEFACASIKVSNA